MNHIHVTRTLVAGLIAVLLCVAEGALFVASAANAPGADAVDQPAHSAYHRVSLAAPGARGVS
ncbi:MAG TPA: hypothetical protein VGF89_03430 [Steroidobacteraceae bacterium]|jgi:hypothetical protein